MHRDAAPIIAHRRHDAGRDEVQVRIVVRSHGNEAPHA